MPIRSILNALSLAALGVGAAIPATAQGVAGSYLAARHASIFSDFRAAADYYARAMIQDPANPVLMESAVQAYIGWARWTVRSRWRGG